MATLQQLTQAEFFSDVIQTLNQENHQLCILHGYTDYPEIINSDVDAISDAPEQIPDILTRHNTALIVQVLQHEATAFYYVLLRYVKDQPHFIALDVSTDYRRNGRVFFKGEDFLQLQRSFKFFHVPMPEFEFAYYLVKKVAKGELNSEHAKRLSDLFRESPNRCCTQLRKFFPEREAQLIYDVAQSEDWPLVRNQLPHLRRALLEKVGREHPLKVYCYWLRELDRIIKRFLQPTGLMVVILGADGSGKSTVITQIKKQLAPAFRKTQYIHLRPRLGQRTSVDQAPVTNPHGELPRSLPTSILKLFYFLFDYGLGYMMKVYPQLVCSTFVLFDRYYQDMLVDPKRYRYGGPQWLVHWISWLIPKPDLWILLDAPAEVLQSRKQEVPFEESLRQRVAYSKLMSGLSNGHIVDASRPLHEVTQRVEHIILDHLIQRTAMRLDLKDYKSFPKGSHISHNSANVNNSASA